MTTFSETYKEVKFCPFYTNGETVEKFKERTGCKRATDKFGDGLAWFSGNEEFDTFEEAQGFIIGRKYSPTSLWPTAAKTRVAKVTKFMATFIDTLDQESGEEVK